MIKSMTGYGRKTIAGEQLKVTVEIKSVNHRFLDFSPKVPRSFLYMEDIMKKKVAEYIHRGHIDLFINLEGNNALNKKLRVEDDLLGQYIDALHSLKTKHELTGDISIDMVTKLEDIFSVVESDDPSPEIESAVLTALEEALETLVCMRSAEGEKLDSDLRKRLESLSVLIDEAESRRIQVIDEHKEKIISRIQETMKDQFEYDDQRLLQEVALLAEKGDITEEIVRFRSHLKQFQSTIESHGAVGRTLDFIVQEFHREINTIGSKSNDPFLSNNVVKLKSEIEKMKEQIQNIE
ncbi:YicC/YloC family endoribonuclease [Halobacillus campisalis]|uniref:YicC/YloC family endoribonuclease n=1 Tax=Halobacillus campisalis TaxID=435909 RepID=A0ABW2K2P1_9BACI|nr:YicC/YloC family endoribonuclease [Halobacillus campisalis]